MTMFLVSSVCVLPSAAFTSTLPGAAMRPAPMKRLDLVLLEQIIDALDVAVDALLLVFEHRREIDARLADLDAHVAELVPGFLVKLRRIAAAPSTGCSRY